MKKSRINLGKGAGQGLTSHQTQYRSYKGKKLI